MATSQEKEIQLSIDNIKLRLSEMGYEFISNDSAGKVITYKCSRCGSISSATKNVINKEYVTKRWKLCKNCGFCNIHLNELLEECKKSGSPKSLISSIKQSKMYEDELCEMTQFLNDYSVDINERVYYIWNSISDVVKCPYCGDKAKWTGRITDGYKSTCCSKECESKRISDYMTGKTVISDNRLQNFKEWEKSVKTVNDDIIKENIRYYYLLEHITNPIILDYLNNRFDDSDSLEETLQRIEMGVEKKPICANPDCNNPVKWIGRKRALYTTYCCDSCSANSAETDRKKRETNLRNWGTENVYDSSLYQKKCMDEFGKPYVFFRDDVVESSNRTKMERYGTIYPSKTDAVKKKIKETTKKNWGVGCMFELPEVRKKAAEALLANGKSGTSTPEKEIYDILKTLFDNVEYHRENKVDDVYKYSEDYYVPEYNLYIEYQGSQYHHGSAYLGSEEDIAEVERLNALAEDREHETGHKSQYSAMIYQWADLDVRKRELATENSDKFNYLEIYSYKNAEDIIRQISLYINCLEGKKPIEYSEESIMNEYDYYKNVVCDELCDNVSNRNIIVKNYQFCEFYKEEMNIYAHNPILRRELIQNRMKFLNKRECELTVSDIIGGFKKSGMHYGYSHFNPLWTNWFVHKYGLKSVYDPCGGWGHHMLGMLSCEKIVYNDFNSVVCSNVRRMKEDLCIDNLEINCGDAREYVCDDVDGWFMCPPYYNIEEYNSKTFHSIEDYKCFLNDIFRLWKSSSARVFGLIIREDFVDLIDCEWSEVYDMNVGNSHFSKNKKNKEKFYIFYR